MFTIKFGKWCKPKNAIFLAGRGVGGLGGTVTAVDDDAPGRSPCENQRQKRKTYFPALVSVPVQEKNKFRFFRPDIRNPRITHSASAPAARATARATAPPYPLTQTPTHAPWRPGPGWVGVCVAFYLDKLIYEMVSG